VQTTNKTATPRQEGQNANKGTNKMKKQYGVVNVSTHDIAKEAIENSASGGTRIDCPLIKIDGVNADVITGEQGGIFTLPDVKECEDETIEIAHRIIGFPVTKELLGHLPSNITAEHLGCLMPFYPFAFHKRFGDTYTDRVCPESTRTGKCAACAGRKELFTSEGYKAGNIQKKTIMDGGFGTRQVALFFSQVYFDGTDYGICANITALTNEMSTTARRENFFDLVANLTSPKKLMAAETLPIDYYANGDGSRWLVAEYIRTMYEGTTTPQGENKKRKGGLYWKLSKISQMAEIPGVGKASDIWWPAVGKKDGAEVVDVYEVINHTDPEEFAAIAEASINPIMNTRSVAAPAKTEVYNGSVYEGDLNDVTWEVLVDMDVDDLVGIGVKLGGEPEEVALIGKANLVMLRNSLAKKLKITPKRISSTASQEASDVRDDVDEDDTPSF